MGKAPLAEAKSVKDLFNCHEGLSVERAKEFTRQFSDARKAFEPVCWRCGKSRSADSWWRPSSGLGGTDPAVNLKLMACRKCREVGRTVLYCSK